MTNFTWLCSRNCVFQPFMDVASIFIVFESVPDSLP